MDNETSSNNTSQTTSSFNLNSAIMPNNQRSTTQRTTTSTRKSSKVEEQTNKPLTNLDKLQYLISSFEQAYVNGNETIQIWINLCNFINTTNDPKVYQAFYVWFAKHMEESKENPIAFAQNTIALSGIHTVQNLKIKTMISTMHQCYQELARVLRSGKGHFRFTTRSMQILGISDSLSRWFYTKGNN